MKEAGKPVRPMIRNALQHRFKRMRIHKTGGYTNHCESENSVGKTIWPFRPIEQRTWALKVLKFGSSEQN